jgi:hypothetical protein
MKLRKGWFKKAKKKWIKKRLFSFRWYSSDASSICASVEWRNGNFVRYNRGLFTSTEEQQALEYVLKDGFFAARHICQISDATMYFDKYIDFSRKN